MLGFFVLMALLTGCSNFGRTPSTQGWTVLNFCPRDGTPMHVEDQQRIAPTAEHPYGGMEQVYACATDLPDRFTITNWYTAPVKGVEP